MIDREAARQLLDFGARIGQGPRAEEQLDGAVALHNILEQRGVAYLADEVGMGKTYVALGALALFRHYQPDFRVLFLAPRENIQQKWIKEIRNFIAHNVRFADMRLRDCDRQPVRPLVSCDRLIDLVHEATLNPNRDFFARLSSFSLPITGKETVDPESAKRLRNGLRRCLPWMADEVFDLRNKHDFKDNVARALCCALPVFDLVIVDEGHNLKHGFSESVSARNRVLAIAMGHPDSEASTKLFPGFGPRAKRVLFLSATPVEETYLHLWNQLNVFGLAGRYSALVKQGLEEEEKKKCVAEFLIRRVTAIKVGGEEHTKNLYRREWRRGGVKEHVQPIAITDPRQRLIVALVQKKVGELLGHERFNTSFQIGMLASFESFLETAKLKREDDPEGNFDDPDQTADSRERDVEREGVDVGDINRLARDYRANFQKEMPHPKMDALVESLAQSWRTGRKAIVFVRRVASVKELKKKLDENYDEWLLDRLKNSLPEVRGRIEGLFGRYLEEKRDSETRAKLRTLDGPMSIADDSEDNGGNDTFFAWFFRGEGPGGVVSGANIQKRFIQRGAAYATFFKDNHVARVLGCNSGDVERNLSRALNMERDALRAELRERSRAFLPKKTIKGFQRADRFEAVQAAAIQLLSERPGPMQSSARIVWNEWFSFSLQAMPTSDAPEIDDWLELRTFFTELTHRDALRAQIWPCIAADPREAFLERELRAQLLAASARLGHAFIDLYEMTIRRLKTLELRAQETSDLDNADVEFERIREYLDLLERQMNTPLGERGWGAFDEITEIAQNFNLILDANVPDANDRRLSETARLFGGLMRQQQPVSGMSGQVNQTAIRQFRMPGYPLLLITTDLLQEGEDLHTFCSDIHHYGISWTPSSMEQRIGRIDRVRSQTDRRLTQLQRTLEGEDKLQVYFPHLEDTVEVLQVQRVLERMNVFLRLMHEGLIMTGDDSRTLVAAHEFVRTRRVIPQIAEKLKSAFPVSDGQLQGDVKSLAVDRSYAEHVNARLLKLREAQFNRIEIEWETDSRSGMLLGTAHLSERIQPFTIQLKSGQSQSQLRCTSPVGRIELESDRHRVVECAARNELRIGALFTGEENRSFNVTVEGCLLLGLDSTHDAARAELLISRVVNGADLLERELLSDRDEPLATFRADLERDIKHDR